MKNTKSELIGAVIILLLVVVAIYGMTIWTDRNLEFAISYFKGVPVEIPTWLSFLAMIVFNAIALAFFNVICEIARVVI